MSDVPDYKIIPANQNCSDIQNKPVIKLTSGTETANAAAKINNFHTQHQENIKYDSIDSVEIKPLAGGNKNIKKEYKINFLKKDYTLFGNNELDVIEKFLNKRIFKKENILEIKMNTNKNSSIYIVKANVLNQIKKIH